MAAEVGANENLNLRMTSSLIRHHIVLRRPLMAWLHEGRTLAPADLAAELGGVLDRGRELVAGRLRMIANGSPLALYKPVGYVLSLTKDNLSETMDAREQAIRQRLDQLREDSRRRLAPGRRTDVSKLKIVIAAGGAPQAATPFIYGRDFSEPWLAVKLALGLVTPDQVRAYQERIPLGRRMVRYMDQLFFDPDGTWFQ